MIVMGLDVSTKTGVAIVESGKKIVHTQMVEHKKLTGWDRAAAIAGDILEMKASYNPDLVVLENYGFSNAHTLVTLVEIGTVIRYFLWQEGQLCLDVPPTSLKKFLGKGNLKKEMVRLETFKQHGFEDASNDVVDAYVLAIMGLAMVGDYPLYSYQYDAINNVKSMRESKIWQPKRLKEST